MPCKIINTNTLICCQTSNRNYHFIKINTNRTLWLLYIVYMSLCIRCECSIAEPSARLQVKQHHEKSHQHMQPSVVENKMTNTDIKSEPYSCPNCVIADRKYGYDKISDDEMRIEGIKRQILSKLGLKSRPNMTSSVPRDVVLQTLYRAEETSDTGLGLLDREREITSGSEGDENIITSTRPPENEADDYFGRTSEIISFAEPGHTLNGQPLLEFNYSHDDSGGTGAELRVKGASLWVRVDLRTTLPKAYQLFIPPRNLTLWVFRILHSNTTQLSGKEFDEHTELAASLPVAISNLGWQKFDLTSTVRDWYSTARTFHHQRLRLLVDCSGCSDLVEAVLFRRPAGTGTEKNLTNDPHRPFLVIHTDPAQTKRVRRRALECQGPGKSSGQCCKQRFYVSFKHLGWEDWIIAPGGYYANYCRGDCGGIHRTPDTFLNYYTHVMEEYRKMDRLTGIEPCCAPLKFSSMSLIYFGPDSNIIKRDLPKMVVDECGCP